MNYEQARRMLSLRPNLPAIAMKPGGVGTAIEPDRNNTENSESCLGSESWDAETTAHDPGHPGAKRLSGSQAALPPTGLDFGKQQSLDISSSACNGSPVSPAADSSGIQSDVRSVLETAWSLVDLFEMFGMNLAADNLRHWLEGNGARNTIAADYFRDLPRLQSWLHIVPRKRFIDGMIRRYKNGEVEQGKYTKLSWHDSFIPPFFTDLHFGLGTFTMDVEVEALWRIEERAFLPDLFVVEFRNWRNVASDYYDFNSGDKFGIPPFRIQADDLNLLKKHGLAHDYEAVSMPWHENGGALVAPWKMSQWFI